MHEENAKIETCMFVHAMCISDAWSMADGVRLLQSRSSAEDGDIKRTSAIQDNGRNENQRPKVVPSCLLPRPNRVASPCFAGDESVETRAWMSVEGAFSIIAVELTGANRKGKNSASEMGKRVLARFQWQGCARMYRDRISDKESNDQLIAREV